MHTDDPARFRLSVVAEALRLFSEQGYEATTVDEIAQAAGISRRTFFRQFRAKEDVVFADHEILFARASDFLAGERGDPWDAVCDAALLVFDGFSHWRDMARRRYTVVQGVPALRDREIVTVFAYERLFVEHLRRELPDAPDLQVVQFAAAVTATHNYLLRRMVRDGAMTTNDELRDALAGIRNLFGARATDADEVVIAVFPRGTAPRRVADLLQRRLNRDGVDIEPSGT
ncbi:TetR family transcriptional regulator [Antrihabitans sp. YC3-6]|uniref:TetR family transcriptional regulator n=1 Tax=Antrihabitans stalagmiti TaxID=2799499 RepID=A0A934U1Y3_9NOCA|nr:TetR family transcriptional regulator [Antrihabitans stalagmiti]MBJ8338432.1 TetR family transcriptional regulator [Antrihabitans stalagmiti]